MASVSTAGTFTFPVQTEQVVTGGTSGIAGAQGDDGVFETLAEADADLTPDPVTFPSPQVRVQRGLATLAAGSISVDVPISVVNLSRAFLVFGASFDNVNPGESQVSGQIVDSTTLRFERAAATGPGISLSWNVAEFASGVFVQRGSVTMTLPTISVPIATVDLTRSFPIVSYRTVGAVYSSDDYLRAAITSPMTLELTVSSSGSGVAEWQVIEYTSSSVQTADLPFGPGDSTLSVTISSVDTTKSWLLYTYTSSSGTGANISQKMIRGIISDSSTLIFDRDSDGQDVYLTWYLVEFTDSTTVQRGSASFATTDIQDDIAVSCVDRSKTIATAGAMYHRGGRTPYTVDDNPGIGSVTLDLTTSTNLRLIRGGTGSVIADIGWFVVHFLPDTGCLIGGAFPTDVQTENDVFIQYRETTDFVSAEIGYRSNTSMNGVSSPKTRTWDGSTWSPEIEHPTAGSPIRALRLAWSRTVSNTRIIVVVSDDGWLGAYVCAPTCAMTDNLGRVWTGAPGLPQKRFDLAYESSSGEALLVYATVSGDATRDLAYRTYAGGLWGAEQYLDDAGHATDVQYASINLASRAGNDEIGLIAGDLTNGDVNAWIWDGGSFGFFVEITAAAETPDQEKVAIAWESASGHLLAVTVPSGSTNIVYREFATSWGAASTFQCANDNSEYISLKPNPLGTANDMILTGNDDVGAALNLNTCYWTGTGWANFITHDTGIDSTTTRPFDFAWENSGSRGILVWGTTSGQITYRTFTAPNVWGSFTNVAMGANTHPWVQLRTNLFARPGETQILGAVMEATALDLGSVRWDGTTFTVIGPATATADTGMTTWESFELEYPATNNDRLSVRYDWSGVPSGDSYSFQVKGYRQDENVNVEVFTPPSTWMTRLTISATTNTMYTYALTSQEFGSGAPSIRFVNPPGVDATASDLFLDWVAITSQNLQYSLEVRQNITGIVTASSAALVVKGNTSAGGESYHVHAWNFTRAAWDVLLVAPFTTTSAYHNVSLTTSYLLAGTVRVRFVDAASQDTIGWALSLDFVAVVATNVPPTVGTAGVSPSTGTLATAFTFYVTYVDAEDDAPLFVNLTLDGVSYVMSANNSADTTYADGKEYYVTVTIANRGTFNYSFSTRASIGDMVLASTPVRQVTVSNRGPTITTAVTILTTYRNSSFAYVVDAVDPDPDALSWSLRTNATFLSIGAANGTLAGLTLNVPSTYWVEVTVSDAFGGTDRLTFTLALVNRPPQVLVTASETGRENELYEASFSAIDPDGDPVGWSLATNATWLALNPSNATLAGIALPGVYYVNLTASDAYGGFAFRNFTIRIAAAPIVRNEPDGLGGELFLLIVIVAALGVLIGALLLPRRRQLVDQAFLIDQDGEIRFHYSTPGAPFDEAKLWSHLQGQPWRDMTSVAAHPHTLHVVRREGLHWILVSRSSDSSRVIKAAEKLFMAAQMDLEAIGAQIPAPEVNTGET